MQEIVTAVTQIGILPMIILILLWDYSKKLTALQLAIQTSNQVNDQIKINTDLIMQKLDKLEDKL